MRIVSLLPSATEIVYVLGLDEELVGVTHECNWPPAVGQRCQRRHRRTLLLEWGDPLFNAGHWLPGMVQLAGGSPVLAQPGADSVRFTWDQVRDAAPEVVVFSPCGYDLDAAVTDGRALADRPELADAEWWAVDADSYFVRPGPRLVDGAEILASILHPDQMGWPRPGAAARLKGRSSI